MYGTNHPHIPLSESETMSQSITQDERNVENAISAAQSDIDNYFRDIADYANVKIIPTAEEFNVLSAKRFRAEGAEFVVDTLRDDLTLEKKIQILDNERANRHYGEYPAEYYQPFDIALAKIRRRVATNG